MKRVFRPIFSLVCAGVALAGGAGVVPGPVDFAFGPVARVAAAADTSPSAKSPAPQSPTADSAAASPSAVAPTNPAPTARVAQAPKPRAAGGQGILASLDSARVVAVGHIESLRKVDRSGWSAGFVLDLVMSGQSRVGETIDMAWEELAVSRRVRFDNGDRLLVVLEDIPDMSLWHKRFPAAGRKRPVLAIAARGDAFLRDPDPATLNTLEHYVGISPKARMGSGGLVRLAEIAVLATTPLAMEALDRLDAEQDLATSLGSDGAATVLEVALSARRDPELRSRALALAASHKLAGTREAATELAEPGSPLRLAAWRALAALPEGISADDAAKLLEESDPELRAVGLVATSGPDARATILRVAREDSAPVVRAAAGALLLRRFGTDAIDDAIGLLADNNSKVRVAVATAVGRLGAPAVTPLRHMADTGSDEAAEAAVLGLAKAGPAGASAIAEIADTHKSETVRTVAELALGRAPDNHKH